MSSDSFMKVLGQVLHHNVHGSLAIFPYFFKGVEQRHNARVFQLSEYFNLPHAMRRILANALDGNTARVHLVFCQRHRAKSALADCG
jgi:hypothetical protein